MTLRPEERRERPATAGSLSLRQGQELGPELYELAELLYPVCRSLTGPGVRETLELVTRQAGIELAITEIPTGTKLYDWTVPREWVIREAHVTDPNGVRVIDFADSNLHVVGYSVPVRARVTREELDLHLHSLPDAPNLVPYRTAYYADTWGFCLAHHVRESLTEPEYDVVIDAERVDGSLTIAEARVAGSSDGEVLLSCNTCHPSLANDGVSGIALCGLLAREVAASRPRLGYRFLFGPGILGPLAWLSQNEHELARVRHGLVVSCVGDSGALTYKRSRQNTAATDRIVEFALRELGVETRLLPFVPWGGDERQFCSPGFDLPVGCLSRTPHGEYPEYHTSADDLGLISSDALAQSWDAYAAVLSALDGNVVYERLDPKGEPQLGRRGLYREVSAGLPTDAESLERARLWVLNLADGRHDLIEIANRAQLPSAIIGHAAAELLQVGLLRIVDDGRASQATP